MKRVIPALLLLATAGCLERGETLTFREDGSAHLEVRIKGDPRDVKEGEAMPAAESGWQVSDRVEVDDKGNETLHRTATRDVAVGKALPGSWAPPGSRLEQLGTAFPTAVTVDRRADGTYYHFRRDYRRRESGPIEFLRREAFENDPVKALLAKDPKTLAADERALLVRTLVEFGAQEVAMHLQTAAERLPEPLPQLAFLKARERAQAVVRDSQLADRLLALVTGDEKPDLAPLEAEVRRRLQEEVEGALRSSGVPAPALERYANGARDVREAYELTQDLADESCVVRVELPGLIVGHNADGPQNEDLPPGAVEWRFPGKALFDRDVILLATSFLPRQDGAEKR